MAQFKSYDDIGVSTEGHVATIEIQRPPHNFLITHLSNKLPMQWRQ